MATRLTPQELMQRLMMQAITPPAPPPQQVPWYYENDFVGPPSPPKAPSKGLVEATRDSYKQSMDQATAMLSGGASPRTAASHLATSVPLSMMDSMFPEVYQKDIERSLPDWLGPAKPFVAGALDFDPTSYMTPLGMAKAPIKGAKAAAKAAQKSIADEYINFSKIGLSDEGEAGLRGLIEKYVAAPPEVPGSIPPKTVLPDSAVRAAANKIDPESLFLLDIPKPGSGGFDEATSLALRDSVKGRMADLQKWTTAANTATDDASKTVAAARAAIVENDLAKLVGIQSGARAEAGRGLRVWRQMAEETTDPSFWLSRAAQKTGGRLPGDKAIELNAILKQIADATDDEAQSLGKLRLAKWMNQFEEHGIIDVALAWRKAGLVSGIKSHARNVGGNLGFGALREISQVPEFVADTAFSLFSKQSTIAPPGINIPRGMHAAATKGVKEAAQVLKHGTTLDAAKKFDLGYQELNSTVFGGGKVDKAINTWVNYNFRALGAEDKMFRSYAFQRALDDGAYATARTMKLQGKLPAGSSVSDYAKMLAESPTDALRAEAMYAADYAVFANKNALASLINYGKQGNQALRVGLDLAMPYVTTPTNIIARMIEYTPFGTAISSGIIAKRILSEGFTPAQQKALSQAIGRGATGSSLVYMGYMLAEKGMLTGHPSDVAGERGVQMAAGRQPMSIRLGDTWYRINEFSPEAPLLVTGATLYETSTKSLKDEARRPDKVVGGMLKSLEEAPLMQGVEIVSRAMQDPTNAVKGYGREQLGTMVPTIVADAGRATDDKVRTTYLKESGWLDSMKERMPGLRKSLPVLQDVYGRDVQSETRHAYDPTLPRKESPDPVRKEMAKINASITKPRQAIGESNADYLLRQEVQGRLVFKRLQGLVASPEWSRMDDNQKRAAVSYVRSSVGREISGVPPSILKKLKEKLP